MTMPDSEYIRCLALKSRFSVGHTPEGKEHADRLEKIADTLSAPARKVEMSIKLRDVLDALRKYEQIDLNGVYVKVSRAALEEAIEVIESRYR